MDPITIGKQYIFNYPKEFVTLPAYSSQRGKVVKVLGVAQDGNEDVEPMYNVRTEDGWVGEAFESELIDTEVAK